MTHWAQSGTSNSLILVFKDWEWLWSSGWSGLITRYFTCTRQYPWPQFLFSISCEKDLFQVIYISECSGGSLKWKVWCTYRGQQPPWCPGQEQTRNEGSPGVLGGQVIRWLGGHVCRSKLGVRSWFLDAVRNEYENICGVMFQNWIWKKSFVFPPLSQWHCQTAVTQTDGIWYGALPHDCVWWISFAQSKRYSQNTCDNFISWFCDCVHFIYLW